LKVLKSKKALSPVVAAIVLIAVSIAVSIAVAAWMGSITMSFMGSTEQLTITDVTFSNFNQTEGKYHNITITAYNGGSGNIVLVDTKVAGESVWASGTYKIGTETGPISGSVTLSAGSSVTLEFNSANGWTSGLSYNVELITSSGNKFPYLAKAPS